MGQGGEGPCAWSVGGVRTREQDRDFQGIHQPSKGFPSQRGPQTLVRARPIPSEAVSLLNLSGSAMTVLSSHPAWNVLPQHKALTLFLGPHLAPCLESGYGNSPRDGYWGQAPQSDGHGSRALTGLPLTKSGRSELLCHCLRSRVTSHTSPPAVRLKNKRVVVKGWVEM